MIRIWREARTLWEFFHSRVFALGILAVICAFVIFKITSSMNAIYVIDGNQRSIAFTLESNPDKLVQNFAQTSDPAVQQTVFPGLSGAYGEMNSLRSLQVSVQADGQTIVYRPENGTTVAELLYANGISYDGNDLLSPDGEKPLEDGDEVILQRVEYEQYLEDEVIPYETVHKNSSLLQIGASRRIQEGEDGVRTYTYVQRTVDGVQEEVQLLGQKVTKQPVTETIRIGSPTPISTLDFDLDVDENGKPMHYKKLLTNQVATGYSARPGAKTASGRYALPGHVAVNPNEIPYGSKLYIVSSDNHFVYGCAIAADTGTGLLSDIVDVDLFYETYAESVLNGRRIVDIYVLE